MKAIVKRLIKGFKIDIWELLDEQTVIGWVEPFLDKWAKSAAKRIKDAEDTTSAIEVTLIVERLSAILDKFQDELMEEIEAQGEGVIQPATNSTPKPKSKAKPANGKGPIKQFNK